LAGGIFNFQVRCDGRQTTENTKEWTEEKKHAGLKRK
jgi:hypothetical protein